MAEQTRNPLRIAVYIRMANTDQTAIQLEFQKELFINEIGSIPNGTLADFYIEGKTRSYRDRPELQRLLADCHAGKIDQVMTRSVGILSRNIADALALLLTIKSSGTTLRLLTEGLVI